MDPNALPSTQPHPHISLPQGDLALDARYRLPSQVAALTATLKRNADYIKAAFNTESIVGKEARLLKAWGVGLLG